MDDDPATEILEATHRVLRTRGYGAITIQDIADEADRSTASIHYYYDSKRDLFLAFLDHLYERFTGRIDAVSGDTPLDKLRSLIEVSLTDAAGTPGRAFRTAKLEVVVQAPYDERIQRRIAEFDEVLFERFHAVIAAGIDAGDFDENTDSELVAEFLTTTVHGIHTRRGLVDRAPDALCEATTEYVETQLVADATPEVAH